MNKDSKMLKNVLLYPEEIDEIRGCLNWAYKWRWFLPGNPIRRRSLSQQLEAVKLNNQPKTQEGE